MFQDDPARKPAAASRSCQGLPSGDDPVWQLMSKESAKTINILQLTGYISVLSCPVPEQQVWGEEQICTLTSLFNKNVGIQCATRGVVPICSTRERFYSVKNWASPVWGDGILVFGPVL
jgi:hypothetical protein